MILYIDDNRGVTEPLNETTGGMTHYPTWTRRGDGIAVTGRYSLILSKLSNGMKELRTAMDQYYLPLTPFYSSAAKATKAAVEMNTLSSSLSIDLPLGIHLVTLQRTSSNELLIRLAHQYAINEDVTYSEPIELDLGEIFKAYNPKSFVELTLSANEDKNTQLKNKIQWNSNGKANPKSSKTTKDKNKKTVDVNNMVVMIHPMEIKTFTLLS